MAAVNFNALLDEFKRTNWKDPGTWHALPKLVVLLGILIAIPVAGYFIDTSSQLEDLERLRGEEARLKEQYLDKKKQAINLDLHRQQLREIDTQFGALLRQLPNRSQMDALLVDINQAGLGRGLQFELFKPAPSETVREFYAEVPIQVKAAGNYHDRGAFALGAWGGEEQGPLKQELAELTKDLRGRVEPLPQVRPYEPVPYTAEGQIDPFRPERIDVAAAGSRASVSKLAPDPNRPKEPLESFPLESIQMLGTITRNKEVFALVKAGPNLYRVQKGNYMGQNFGVVTAIDEGAINLKELVQDSGGGWVERTSALPLGEGKR